MLDRVGTRQIGVYAVVAPPVLVVTFALIWCIVSRRPGLRTIEEGSQSGVPRSYYLQVLTAYLIEGYME